MAREKNFFICMRVQRWNTFTAQGHEVVGPPGTLGVIVVYKTKAAAKKDFPDDEVIEIRVRERGQK